MVKKLVFLVLLMSTFNVSFGQLIFDQNFYPEYSLERNAGNYSGPKSNLKANQNSLYFESIQSPVLQNHQPTEKLENLFYHQCTKNEFSLEFLLIDHVNQTVGFLLNFNSPDNSACVMPNISYFNKQVDLFFDNQNYNFQTNRNFKKYWQHVVVTFKDGNYKIYLNNEMKQTFSAPENHQIRGKDINLSLYGYFENEPYMEISNLLKNIRFYENELSEEQIKARFNEISDKIEKGKFLDENLHFTVQPYLHYVTQNSINIIWETSEPCKSIIKYGEELPLSKTIELTNSTEINETEVGNLKPETPYFYSITSKNGRGEEINSGTLTFKTANKETTPFAFAVIGDTESRPHINNRISQLIWDERPDFLVHMGDITDGGKEPHKFEWTYEYFAGMSPLISRVPVFPVPGNGEGDLYWYKAYHKLPEHEEFYSFKYGNAEFFMLNSVQKEEFKPGGRQYVWLDEKLANSNATWKFVCLHYAPYSSDEDDYGDTWKRKSTRGDEQIRAIVPIYEKHNVDVVFYGHLHCYERSHKIVNNEVTDLDGVTYVLSGGAGGNLEDFAPTRSPFTAKTFRGHHYLTVTINGENLQLKMYDLEGRLLDFLDLKK